MCVFAFPLSFSFPPSIDAFSDESGAHGTNLIRYGQEHIRPRWHREKASERALNSQIAWKAAHVFAINLDLHRIFSPCHNFVFIFLFTVASRIVGVHAWPRLSYWRTNYG